MATEEMASDTRAAERARRRQLVSKAAELKEQSHITEGEFWCERCFGSRCAHTQNLAVESCIRSGGEPVTTSVTFVSCLACGHKWTERSGQQ
mmetsp:Transcript_31259/g.72543  ORF Transcript_31259/g.72543 Transcript_31259/m.72543 type:complete len:92 (+) Transcript_31259:277-552(+)